MDKFTCPNRNNHRSAWPGYGRELCPYCREVYVEKPKEGSDNAES